MITLERIDRLTVMADSLSIYFCVQEKRTRSRDVKFYISLILPLDFVTLYVVLE